MGAFKILALLYHMSYNFKGLEGEHAMEIYTTSQARAELFKLVDTTNLTHDPIYIVGRRSKAVLIAEEDYRAMQETLHLMSVPGLKNSILVARQEPLNTCVESIDWDDL